MLEMYRRDHFKQDLLVEQCLEVISIEERLREIDSRLRMLQKKLDSLTVVREPPPRRDRVYFGAFVTV